MASRRDCLRCFALGLGTGAVFLPVAYVAGRLAGEREGRLHASSPLDVVDAEIYCPAKLIATAGPGEQARPWACVKRDGHLDPTHESEIGHLWR